MKINTADLFAWLERDRFCAIVSQNDGPQITTGQQPARGSATAVVGITGAPAGYQSGSADNPDAAPNVYFAFAALKDPLYLYKEGGGALVAGGYPNQIVGIQAGGYQSLDFTPSAIATANIAALQANTSGTPLNLTAGGAGITVTSAALTVLNSQNVVPSGQRQIDGAPTWVGFSQSGAVQIWAGTACGRAVSLTSAANLSAITYTVRGYDLYGFPQTENITGPNVNTVNGKKGWKWITSITPNATNASTVSVGTADIYEFPIRADKFAQVSITWNNAFITANTGFVAADTTNPATSTTGSVRGTYAVQSASDGTKQLQVEQFISPANLNANPQRNGIYGIVPA